MKSHVVLSSCVLLLLAGSLSAGTTVFNGSVNDAWSNVDNWSEGFPEGDDKFRMAAEMCILDYPAESHAQNAVWEGGSIGHLRLVDGAELSVSQWSIIGYNGGEADARHTLEVLGGVYNGGIPERANDGRIYVGREGFAQLIIDYNGRVNLLHQDMQVGSGSGGDGVVNLWGGILDCGTRRLRLATNATATAHVDISGGILKQPASQRNLDEINGWIESGLITAYNGDGTVVVTETEAGDMLVKGLHPMNPVPADSVNIGNGSVTLEWTMDAGTVVDVWVGTRADLGDFEKIVDKKTVTSAQINAAKDTRYFWAVDTYVAGAEEPTFGPVFDFLAENLAPVVTAGADVTTWVENGSVDVALTGTVNETAGTTWTVISGPEGAVIADAKALDTTVTMSALGTYVLELTANDGEKDAYPDTLTINVFADSCLAAQSLPDYVALPGDIDGDCDVDQDDLDMLMADWLQCVALGQCDPNGI